LMAKFCDSGLVNLIHQEVEITIGDRLRELGKRFDKLEAKLESEQQIYSCLHDQVL